MFNFPFLHAEVLSTPSGSIWYNAGVIRTAKTARRSSPYPPPRRSPGPDSDSGPLPPSPGSSSSASSQAPPVGDEPDGEDRGGPSNGSNGNQTTRSGPDSPATTTAGRSSRETRITGSGSQPAYNPNDLSDLSDLSSEESESEGYKIPKPPGESGRPGSGGYNLEGKLGWEKKKYQDVKVLVKRKTLAHCDRTKGFHEQEEGALNKVRQEVAAKYSFLAKDYDEFWPIDDMIRSALKYERQQTRRKAKDVMLAKLVKEREEEERRTLRNLAAQRDQLEEGGS
ncbi:hypothetical protein V5O48_017132, partial [Marasmius crinis-equi]